jgi:hypothetical protein
MFSLIFAMIFTYNLTQLVVLLFLSVTSRYFCLFELFRYNEKPLRQNLGINFLACFMQKSAIMQKGNCGIIADLFIELKFMRVAVTHVGWIVSWAKSRDIRFKYFGTLKLICYSFKIICFSKLRNSKSVNLIYP